MARLGVRNQKPFHYALYVGDTPIVDEYGNETGEKLLTYDTPVIAYGRITPARGTADVDLFGTATNYTKTITVTDMECPINEYTKLWVDETETDKPSDYVVVSVARDINYIVYAIRKVSNQ